jgi:hypothetical protein
VGMNLLETVRNAPAGVDCVLAVHNGVDRKSFKKNLVTVAEKLAHVPTLTFGSFDVDKNELPAELDLGQDVNKEGIWIFKAGGGAAPLRAKRKAKLSEIAKWIKKSATIAFEAKAPPLPEGTYTESCTGCRVHTLAGDLTRPTAPATTISGEECWSMTAPRATGMPTKLICSDCPGGEGGDASLNMAECVAAPAFPPPETTRSTRYHAPRTVSPQLRFFWRSPEKSYQNQKTRCKTGVVCIHSRY